MLWLNIYISQADNWFEGYCRWL